MSRRWLITQNGKEYSPELALKANHLEVNNQDLSHFSNPFVHKDFKDFWFKYDGDRIKGRDLILRSIAPEVIH